MKKVYGSLKMLILISIFFYFPLSLFVKYRVQITSIGDWFWPVAFVVCCGVAIFFSLTASWSYGEKGIEILNRSGDCLKKYNWSDVSRIAKDTPSSKGVPSWPLLEMKDGNKLVIWYFSTRNYLSVLSDVVRYVRKKNPEAYIDSWVLKKVEKYL